MSEQICPHCGAEIFDKADNYTLFKCDSIVWNNGSSFIQRECLKNQIAAQAAEIERLTERNKILEETVRIACEEYPVEVK